MWEKAEKLCGCLEKFGKGVSKDLTESELRANFIGSGVLEVLGYSGATGRDVRLEQRIRGKMSDLLVLDELEEDKGQTKSPSVAELEHEINGLVYQLYGLDERDKGIIGDFLEKF